MQTKPKVKRPRTKLKCPQCQCEIILFSGHAEYFQPYAHLLCKRCAPALYTKCGTFYLPTLQPRPTPPPDPSKGVCEPAKAQAAHDAGDCAAFVLWEAARNGNQCAAEKLLELTCRCVDYLHRIAAGYPDLLRPTAQTMIVWPFFISDKDTFKKDGLRLLKNLKVGTKPFLGGKWEATSPSFITAHMVLKWLDANSTVLGLPPISKAAMPVWFEIGWKRLLFETNYAPDKDPFLWQIGKSAKNKKSTSRGLPEQTTQMLHGDVTAKIKELVRKSFLHLFEDSPP